MVTCLTLIRGLKAGAFLKKKKKNPIISANQRTDSSLAPGKG